jgi:hypothetical protein
VQPDFDVTHDLIHIAQHDRRAAIFQVHFYVIAAQLNAAFCQFTANAGGGLRLGFRNNRFDGPANVSLEGEGNIRAAQLAFTDLAPQVVHYVRKAHSHFGGDLAGAVALPQERTGLVAFRHGY